MRSQTNYITVMSQMNLHRIARLLRIMTRKLGRESHVIIADIGAGRGEKSRYFADVLPSCFIASFEIDQRLAKIAKSKSRNTPNLDIIIADAQNLPMRDQACTAAILWNVLMFIKDDRKAIDESLRVLKPLGYILLSIYPAKRGLRRYRLIDILKLTSLKAVPVYYDKIGLQHELVLVKPKGETKYKIIRLRWHDASVFLNRFKALYGDEEIILLIPLQSECGCAKSKEVKKSFSKLRVNAYLVSLTYFYSMINKVYDAVSLMLTSRRRVFSFNEVANCLIREHVTTKSSLTKCINDLIRLGILRLQSIEVVTFKDYAPGCNVASSYHLAPTLASLELSNLEIPDTKIAIKSVLPFVIIQGNPILRVGAIMLLHQQKTTITEFTKYLTELIKSKYNMTHNVKRELNNVMSNKSKVVERVLNPLSKLGLFVASPERDIIRLSPSVEAALKLKSCD